MKLIKNYKSIAIMSVLSLALAGVLYLKVIPHTVYVESSSVYDFSDDSILTRFSDNVFIGKVIKKNGTNKNSGFAETQFDVKVIENIKGNVSDDITVNQCGGTIDNVTYIYSDDKLVEPGKTYLFAARHYAEKNWFTLVTSLGHKELKSDTEKKQLSDKFKVTVEKTKNEPALK